MEAKHTVRISGGPKPQDIRIALDGVPLEDVTRFRVGADADGGVVKVTFTMYAKLDIDLVADVQQHRANPLRRATPKLFIRTSAPGARAECSHLIRNATDVRALCGVPVEITWRQGDKREALSYAGRGDICVECRRASGAGA